MKPISFFNTSINPHASKLLSRKLETTFISEGDSVKKFENEFQCKFNTFPIIALNSGTSALHLSLILAGIKEGDEVIIPAQTFIATGLSVLYIGAIPVFADIEYETGNISIDSIKKLITKKTRAIIPVHWGGLPCRMDKILSIASEHNLIVIEDAAHALGSKFSNKPIGRLSDYTCFSFQAIKHLTTGDGGAIAIKSIDKLHEGLRRRWFGMDRANSKISLLGERDYDVKELGFKYHMNDYSATLGLSNLELIENNLEKINRIAQIYDKAFEAMPNIKLFKANYSVFNAYWLYGFHIEKRIDFIKMMKSKNIPVSVVHQRIDRHSIFDAFRRTNLINQEKFEKTQIHIPLHSNLEFDQIDYIINAIKEGW